MNKEQIKSCALTCLVAINFIFGAKILNDKKLWPNGRNFFSFLENAEIFKKSSTSITKTHITMPRQILVNTGDQTSRLVIRPDSGNFSECVSAASDMIASALKSKDVRKAKKEEWVSALNGKSLCFSYAVEYDTKLFGEFFAVNSSALAEFTPYFSRIIVSADKSVFFEDSSSGDFFVVTATVSAKELTDKINELKSDGVGKDIINYSVDLKFDESLESQVATLSGAAPVYSAPLSFPTVLIENPLIDSNGNLNREIIDRIISVFRINSNTVRRYSEADGTLVCVENNCILKIRPNGIVSYQSTANDGLSLSADNSYIDAVTALADFTDKLTDAAEIDSDLYVSKALSEKNARITFDYRCQGIPINISKIAEHAVDAEVVNGSLVRYTQLFRRYIPVSASNAELIPFISAFDNAAERYGGNLNNIEINEIYPVYSDNGEQSFINADWFTKIKGIEIKEEEIE